MENNSKSNKSDSRVSILKNSKVILSISVAIILIAISIAIYFVGKGVKEGQEPIAQTAQTGLKETGSTIRTITNVAGDTIKKSFGDVTALANNTVNKSFDLAIDMIQPNVGTSVIAESLPHGGNGEVLVLEVATKYNYIIKYSNAFREVEWELAFTMDNRFHYDGKDLLGRYDEARNSIIFKIPKLTQSYKVSNVSGKVLKSDTLYKDEDGDLEKFKRSVPKVADYIYKTNKFPSGANLVEWSLVDVKTDKISLSDNAPTMLLKQSHLMEEARKKTPQIIMSNSAPVVGLMKHVVIRRINSEYETLVTSISSQFPIDIQKASEEVIKQKKEAAAKSLAITSEDVEKNEVWKNLVADFNKQIAEKQPSKAAELMSRINQSRDHLVTQITSIGIICED